MADVWRRMKDWFRPAPPPTAEERAAWGKLFQQLGDGATPPSAASPTPVPPAIQALDCRACGTAGAMVRSHLRRGAGFAISGTAAVVFIVLGVLFFLPLLVLALIIVAGWALLRAPKPVWKCDRCGHYLERAE